MTSHGFVGAGCGGVKRLSDLRELVLFDCLFGRVSSSAHNAGGPRGTLSSSLAKGYENSGYVSTSQSLAVAGGFPDGLPTNVYEVRASGGIDVNDVLGPSSPYLWELEIAYPGGIPSSCIVGCTLPSGQWVPNPNFGLR